MTIKPRVIQMRAGTLLSQLSPDSERTFVPECEPFLSFGLYSRLSFENKSTIYRSLVALVEVEYPFDLELQDRAVQFLKILEPFCDREYTTKLVTDLVHSSDGSPSGFVGSILTLLSTPHSTMVAAALSFLYKTTISHGQKFTGTLLMTGIHWVETESTL
ncbi:hypothetical protein BLNAU_20879 [Blattamonas nauphoetae]|uniref:Uncharacterized protein n=1 Tax=Blattamonas nauphoetae TaxID=2049346 RepID=A0ABQ9WXH0_9EUKA|nr:hypothetical protein BLNAU_20879 [Blattamonas nauphoetae]